MPWGTGFRLRQFFCKSIIFMLNVAPLVMSCWCEAGSRAHRKDVSAGAQRLVRQRVLLLWR